MGDKARTSRHRAALVVVTLLAGTASACAGDPGAAPDPSAAQPAPTSSVSPELSLDGDPVLLLAFGTTLDGEPSIRQLGTADVAVSVASIDGGRLGEAPAPDPGEGAAVRFPGYTGGSPYPRAVLRVEPRAGEDLNPGRHDIEWGADVRMDRMSGGIPVDNGDNVVQRGLSSDDALFKAEVDEDQAACTVRGDRGTVVVRSREPLHASQWYRIRCLRRGDRLQVAVTELGPDGSTRPSSRTRTGRIGTVDFGSDVPISIGGKLAHDGSVVASATDQLNGDLARPVVAFGS